MPWFHVAKRFSWNNRTKFGGTEIRIKTVSAIRILYTYLRGKLNRTLYDKSFSVVSYERELTANKQVIVESSVKHQSSFKHTVSIMFLKAVAQRASMKTNWLAHYDRNLSSKPWSCFPHLACEVLTTVGVLGATQGPQKLWGKWLKILHSRLFLTPKLKFQKSTFIIEKYWKCLQNFFLGCSVKVLRVSPIIKP